MEKFKRFSGSHPILFTLFLVTTWFLVATIAAEIVAVVLEMSYVDPFPQSMGTLFAMLYVVLLAWQFGWLRSSGIGKPGNIKFWFFAVIVFVYLIVIFSYAFFGDLSLGFVNAINPQEAKSIILRQLIVGFVEEILFRGVILYALVRVWGGSKRGLIASVLLSSLLFGIPHLLQVFADRSIGVTFMAILEAIVSGIWFGACVILWSTVWPIVGMHFGSNAFVLLKGLGYPGLVFSYQEYSIAILLELPLVFLSLYWLLKTAPRPVIPSIP